MKATTVVLALVFLLPSLAAALSTVPEAEILDTANSLIVKVGAYSSRHPDVPGAFAPWANGDVAAGKPLLIHSYPALEPSYYYIRISPGSTGRASYVTVGALDGHWQAYGECAASDAFPTVSRAAAANTAGRTLGTELSPSELRVVSMPNKQLYWHARSADSEVFINILDLTDIRAGLDEEISPPQLEFELPPSPHTQLSIDGHTGTEGGRFPGSYDISGVPHHYQGTSYNCGPAASEMVMDYYGPDIDQEDIADVANCTSSRGSRASDVRRSGHFSGISTAIQNPSLSGYDERQLGYAALDCQWSYPDTSDLDYPDRYNDLKNLISSDYPILVLTWYDTSHNSGHFRVVKGYNDTTNVFIAHDPEYSGVYQGPDVNFNQTTFVDNLWKKYYRWGTLIMPWQVEVLAPDEVNKGEQFTVSAIITYHGPHPFEGQDPAGSREATIYPSPLFTLAPGETATQTMPGSTTSGMANLLTWDVVADTVLLGNVIQVMARGLITDSSFSYASYSDSIGGWGWACVTIIDGTGVDEPTIPSRLVFYAPSPSPFSGTTALALDVPAGTGRLTLAIYNARGRLIRTLVDGIVTPGRREIIWNGNNARGLPVAGGVYFAKCEADGQSSTRKLVVVR